MTSRFGVFRSRCLRFAMAYLNRCCRRRWGQLRGCVVIAVLLATATPLRAQAQSQASVQQTQPQAGATAYEDERVDRALAKLGVHAAATPEGKPITFIRLVRQDVFIEGELLFDWIVWFNRFHWLTKPEVIERELRLSEGAPYEAIRARETERNLRALGIFSLVRVVPVEDDEGVGVVVYTRDLWSLRLETVFEGNNDNLQFLAQLTQRNLFGLNQTGTLRFERRWDSFSLGQLFYDYRALSGQVLLLEAADLIFNGETGRLEGGIGNVRVARPFYNLDQRVAWEFTAGFSELIHRDPIAGRVALTPVPDPDADRDAEVTCTMEGPDCLRSVYLDRRASVRAYGLYRLGHAYKQTFAGGGFFSDQHVAAVAETRLPDGRKDEFARLVLPKVRRQVGPFVRYHLFLPRFEPFYNLASFGRVETVQVGPELYAEMSFPLAALGSTANSYYVTGSMEYVLAGHDALASARAYGAARLEGGRVLDQYGSLRVRLATPAWLVGRFVWQWLLIARRRDTANTLTSLSSLTGLRGFSGAEPGLQARGVGVALSNLEFRSLPVDIESVHVGLVAFYDAGGLFRQLSRLNYAHGVGLGLRVLFPQLNRLPFRLDFAVPVDGGLEDGFSVRFAFGDDQVVPLTPEEDDAASRDLRSLSGR